MKKILGLVLAALLMCSMLALSAFALDEPVVYVDYAGDNDNDGLSASTPKQSFDAKGTGAMQYVSNGGTVVACGKLYFGGDYTINAGGKITITAIDDYADYQDPRPATNPAAGAMKLSKDAVLTIASDVTITDIILFHENDTNPNTIVVKSGATLTVTDTVNCMSKGSKYYSIVVEEGGTAIIEGGTFSSITGKGTIKKSNDVVISAGYVDPNVGKPGTVFLNYAQGDDANDGTLNAPKKLFGSVNGAGCISMVKYGGTIVVTGKAYMGGDYTLKDHEGPVTMTSVYDGVDYKNPAPATNPACAFKMAGGKTFTITNDFTFDNIIVFSEYGTETIKVTSGATFTVTDTVEFMNKQNGGYTLVIDAGSTAVLSEAAQKAFKIENNGGKLVTYAEGVATKTVVKMTIGKSVGYINDVEKALDAAPIIRESRTMLPVRFVAEAFGATVAWDGATSTATVKTDDIEIKITIGAKTATVNGATVTLDAPAFIENSRTYMPVRFVAENLGATVAWDGVTSTATLTK